MKKIIISIMALLLLSGCSSAAKSSTSRNLTRVISQAMDLQLPGPDYNNAKKEYYTYFYTKGIGRSERDATSNIFEIYGNKAILNLDVAGIINSTYYTDETAYGIPLRDIDILDNVKQIQTGQCTNSSGEKFFYRIMINDLDSDLQYILVQTRDFVFVATCYNTQADEVLFEMIKIIRSCTADREKVIADYSNVREDQKRSTIITLFKEVLPESGKIIDYLPDWMTDPDFVIIDSGENQQQDPDVIDPDIDNENGLEE